MLGLMPSETGSELLLDDTDYLRSAVYLCLGTDRRAADDDRLPNDGGDKRGWWGDTYRPLPLGSRLWLLSREKQLPETATRAEEYAREALQWLIDQGIVQSVDVSAEWVAQGRLNIDIRITEPDGSIYRYQYLWSAKNAV